jgi:hypothetical protein
VGGAVHRAGEGAGTMPNEAVLGDRTDRTMTGAEFARRHGVTRERVGQIRGHERRTRDRDRLRCPRRRLHSGPAFRRSSSPARSATLPTGLPLSAHPSQRRQGDAGQATGFERIFWDQARVTFLPAPAARLEMGQPVDAALAGLRDRCLTMPVRSGTQPISVSISVGPADRSASPSRGSSPNRRGDQVFVQREAVAVGYVL